MTDLDAQDPLATYRDRFVGTDGPLVYLDGNSLGRPLRVTGDRLRDFVGGEWGSRLIRGWDEGWFALPEVVGDELGRTCLGAAAGQTVVGDSTTVLLYKAMRAAVALRPGRTEIVVDRDNFPTDRYVADGVARECGLRLRWIDVDTTAGVTTEQLTEVVGEQTALVVLSHVAYRSAWLADGPGLTRVAHDAGALVLWDLSHSVGSVPLALDAWDADLAVGCTYKYLNGGPGAPAFVYVARRLLDDPDHPLVQPVQGWMGASDPFLMGPTYAPAPGIRRMLSGTPPVVGMLAVQDMLALLGEVGMDAVRAKSVGLTEHAIALADELLPGTTVASPRDAGRRGGHVTLNHPLMREATAALWQRDVVPDYRDPHGLRLGLSPLSTSFDEVERGLRAVREVLDGLT
ncbi:kynureninase [Nocardioides dongxiaopingii]|uniref:kynureninase n=1 Tax=Nocardioides dongxiaopingii TaxID=2576036 RepID=UPI001FE6C25A|nr:aminotransferase class V-fold PLP-dependent enzyme [Nocardioides dongxiaopingii]